ncbi:PREDICTED: amine oxidase [flavin-containing] A-like [Ceratosolen solmsi marchali]|uniref:Amine oxidase n=1 Tax=Ceratosolen solmsi marchali TaxID=326594 RepID=A0AAJ6YD98_9HYME|nr:PREDICTED: amine oxidase [flavin-containing] A-like [Ceratosolen solmsi marchali]
MSKFDLCYMWYVLYNQYVLFFLNLVIFINKGIAQLKNISALWYIVMLNGAGGFIQRLRVTLGDSNRYFIQGGAMNIARLLTKNINKENQIHCHESVNKIQFNDDRAYIWTNKGHYKCDYVILAVPPLESSKITVEPHLPLNITKAQSSYDKETNVFFNAKSSQLIESNNLTKNIIGITNYNMNLRLAYDATINKDNEFHVSGFLSKTNINSDMKMNLLSILNKCFTSNIELEDLTETSWRVIPGGSPMNVPKPGCLKHHLNLLSESHGRIFFAVSEYAKNWPGTIDGAIEAGKSVAYSILERVRPQSMSSLEWKLHNSLHIPPRINELNIGIYLIHKICFCLNFFVLLSFLQTNYLSSKLM